MFEMLTLIKGTDKGLIRGWILAIEQDIKENKFYFIESYGDPGYLCISSLNKARLMVMYDIFDITANDYLEGSSRYFKAYKGSLKEAEEKMMNYLETMKALLN